MNDLAQKFGKVEKLSGTSRTGRFLHHPVKYALSLLYIKVIYPLTHKSFIRKTKVFWGDTISVRLPAGMDILLTGGKSHLSEIKLAKYMIHHLQSGDTFIDVGAHFGYFTLLASKLVGPNGNVLSFEPGAGSFEILKKNTLRFSNISIFNNAVSSSEETLVFYEFPALYSEYNAIDTTQFEHTNWFKKIKVTRRHVQSIILDRLLPEISTPSPYMKIDVEGAEYSVLQGATALLQRYSPVVIMEFLEKERNNDAHLKAQNFMAQMGYSCYTLTTEGALEKAEDIEAYLRKNGLESDNVVFLKDT